MPAVSFIYFILASLSVRSYHPKDLPSQAYILYSQPLSRVNLLLETKANSQHHRHDEAAHIGCWVAIRLLVRIYLPKMMPQLIAGETWVSG